MTRQRYHIRTFGCQMNIADSQQYSSVLKNYGMEESDNASECDIVLVNTCVVRGKAEEKAISYFGELEVLRRRRPELRYILAGCLAPRVEILELKRRFPGLLFAFNPSEIDNFQNLLKKHLDNAKTSPEALACETKKDKELDLIAEDICQFKYHAFVTIVRGCEQNCTYCIVPFSRGANFSRPQDEIIHEIESRVEKGARAITLLGQSILDYGKDWSTSKSIKTIHGDEIFRNLLDSVSSQFPHIWIKFLTSHPKDFSFETVDLIASRENITRFIHLPVQSGDNSILKRMGRGHTREDYLKLTDCIANKIPDVRLSSDIIVGFPGETDESYEQSLDLIRRVRFFKVFTFQYSPRPYTPALKFSDDVPFEEKRVRLNRLIDLQNQITMECHKELEGSEIVAMVEGASRGDDDTWMARSRDEDIIIFDNHDNIKAGDIILLKIIEGKLRTLRGELIRRLY